jgi:CubicO group peptidase (beta-lactamase class C family)
MRGTSFTNDNGLVTNPSSGAVTTASDYINFLGMLLDNGMFEGKRVLSEKSIADMEIIQYAMLPVKYMPREASGLKMGLGCWIDNGSTVTSLNMTGFYPYIDRTLNYAALLLPRKTDEPKKELYVQFKQKMDAAFGH